MANLAEAFIIRPVNQDEKEFIITIGNHLATEEKFPSREAAEKKINQTDWNLIGAMFYALKEAEEYEKKLKPTKKPTKKEK